MKPLFDENWLVLMSNKEVQMLRVAVSAYLDRLKDQDLFPDLPKLPTEKKYKKLYDDLTKILQLRPWETEKVTEM